MPIRKINPYIIVNGTGRQAIQLYETALGAKTLNLTSFGDVQGPEAPAAIKDLVMHAEISIADPPVMLMLSDAPPDRAVDAKGSVHISLDYTDVDEMRKAFDAMLAGGGTVTMPVQDTFWGATFGMLTDAYGVQWMFNFQHPKREF